MIHSPLLIFPVPPLSPLYPWCVFSHWFYNINVPFKQAPHYHALQNSSVSNPWMFYPTVHKTYISNTALFPSSLTSNLISLLAVVALSLTCLTHLTSSLVQSFPLCFFNCCFQFYCIWKLLVAIWNVGQWENSFMIKSILHMLMWWGPVLQENSLLSRICLWIVNSDYRVNFRQSSWVWRQIHATCM